MEDSETPALAGRAASGKALVAGRMYRLEIRVFHQNDEVDGDADAAATRDYLGADKKVGREVGCDRAGARGAIVSSVHSVEETVATRMSSSVFNVRKAAPRQCSSGRSRHIRARKEAI